MSNDNQTDQPVMHRNRFDLHDKVYLMLQMLRVRFLAVEMHRFGPEADLAQLR